MQPTINYCQVHYNAVQYIKIAGIEAEYQSDAGSTNDTLYLALMGELWGVFCEYLSENWPHFNGTTLYLNIDRLKRIIQYFVPKPTNFSLLVYALVLQDPYVAHLPQQPYCWLLKINKE